MWFDSHRVASATTSSPPGATPAGCGWADLGTIARCLGMAQAEVGKIWEPLMAALR